MLYKKLDREKVMNSMLEALKLYKQITQLEEECNKLKEKMAELEMLELEKNLNCEQLFEFVNSISKYDKTEDVLEKLKISYGLTLENEEVKADIDKLQQEYEEYQEKINGLYDEMHNLEGDFDENTEESGESR